MTRRPRKNKTGNVGMAVTKGKKPARDHVITFRISSYEAGLIQRAADRVPLARYSRDAVLARAAADAK